MSKRIGIFDSGIGGITVLKEIRKALPNEDYIYYSDSINNPYGDKTEKEIIEICNNIVDKLIKLNCKVIVIACNTASAKAAQSLRKKYKNIPIIAIEPAYKMVHDYAYDDTTLVLATKGTIESEKFNLLYNKYNNHKTYLLACIGLADIIEKGEKEKVKEYLNKNLGIYKGKVKNVVLGCTHYPFIKEEIKEVLGEVKFFEGSKNLAKYLKNMMEREKLIENGNKEVMFIDTSNSKFKESRFFEYLNS